MSENLDEKPPTVLWSNVEYYLQRNLDTTFVLNSRESPRVDYVVLNGDIELHVDLVGHLPAPASNLPMIQIEEAVAHGSRIARLRTVDPALRRDFHDLICAIADRMILREQSFDQALKATLHGWNALLRGPRVLEQQRRIGLLGELVVLWALGESNEIGWKAAAEAWMGPSNEEHDFALADYDIEVKTTSSTKPVHTIHGITQLTPKPGRLLWLVSLQVTRGGSAGVTLSALALAVRRKLLEHAPDEVDGLDNALSTIGWEPGETDKDRWVLAAEARIFAVDDDFPRIDESFLAGLSPVNRSRIDQITYRVDLTGIPPNTDGPAALITVHIPHKTEVTKA